ncbi:MAG: DUF3427 domain-containing protein [Lautropia sp.]|nr:DUF3427 domain-containing protein [Lautropia sp.]
MADQLRRILDDLEGEGADKLMKQLGLVNALLVDVRRRLKGGDAPVDLVAPPLRLLHALHRSGQAPERPDTGLALPWLFTAGKGSPALLTELRRELSACDGVDILVSFITHAGVRKLYDILQQVTAVGADGLSPTKIRILTTTYTGATEQKAVDALARLPGAEVRISLDGQRTRLHAKAWLFHRRSGFGSAYVGSANLSGAALMGGLEWTVKFTQRGQTALFERAQAHFETLWADTEFQPYDPDNLQHRQALGQAIQKESGLMMPVQSTFFDLQPKHYQQEMLDQLQREREQQRWRNLLVAATGTGKTVVAAFDYRRICEQLGGRPRLLFVAHREEILRQSLRTFREVLRDHGFGALLAGGSEPDSIDHLFVTIDSLSSRQLLLQQGADHWYMVVIDECHRLAAERFERFVTAVQPKVLLGLTATPERTDGKSILRYFDARPDGSSSVELRLWHALDFQLLCPFEYYACDDSTDFSSVDWGRPGEERALDRLVTGNDMRARLVLQEWQRLAGDPLTGKALVFCVSVAHAEFMTDAINRAGIPAVCVVGKTPEDIRRGEPERLQRGEVAAIVTCDLYNEGVDLPFVDTLLLLRPTQSPVAFQQQIGRGLRLSPGKQSCLVLDFVGRHRQGFRFDRLLMPITGLSRGQLIEGIEQGFATLPAGCHLHLQRQSREQILASLRQLVQQSWRRLTTELQTYVALKGRTSIRLADFIRDQGIELADVYRTDNRDGRSGWNALKRAAGVLVEDKMPEEDYFGRRFGSLLHVDDPWRLALLHRVAEPGPDRSAVGGLHRHMVSLVDVPPFTDTQRSLLSQMLAYQIDAHRDQLGTGEQMRDRLAAQPAVQQELAELAEVLSARAELPARPVPGLEDVPLCLHARYEIREILTAVGWLTAGKRSPFQAGVLALPDRQTELLFVTLDKREGYHERIAYHDYAISADRFHWQSQNSAGPDTRAGRRYLESPGNGWRFQLFVRTAKGEPYRAPVGRL